MSVWDPCQYGWSVVYWLTVEGVPVVWSEVATGLTLPAGYTSESASLVIDDSAAIGCVADQYEGIGKSLPLSFRLQDTAAVRVYMQRSQVATELTADLLAAGGTSTTIDVLSTTGISGGESVYLGNERITIGVAATGTRFTGCTRAVVGYAYTHTAGSISGHMTKTPRYWRGREVKLYATPIDPTGHIPGATIYGDAECIWRGHIDDGPQRSGLHFAFTALALDRRLSRKIGQRWAGVVIDKEARYRVSPKDRIEARITLATGANVVTFHQTIAWFPFSASADGDKLTGSEMRALITSGYKAAVALLGHTATLDDLIWVESYLGGTRKHSAGFTFDAAATVRRVDVWVDAFGAGFVGYTWTVDAGLVAGYLVDAQWQTWDNAKAQITQPKPHKVRHLLIGLTSGIAAGVPATGMLRIKDWACQYQDREVIGGQLFVQVHPLSTGFAQVDAVKIGESVEILGHTGSQALPVAPGVAAARTLASSGYNGLRNATYDTLDAGQGYALDDDQALHADIAIELNTGPLADLRLQIAPDDESFEDLFGGMLALSGRAVVMRPDVDDNRTVKLHLVELAGGVTYETTITDADLLTRRGDAIQVQPWRPKPNAITVEGTQLGETLIKLSFADYPAIQAQGRESLDFEIPVATKEGVQSLASIWAMSILGTSDHMQRLSLSVPPWTAAEVGDVVYLSTAHPSLWDWAAGEPGYAGPARVIGREVQLRNGATTLHLLAASGLDVGALCPSSPVDDTDNATNPTWIDLPIQYLKHMAGSIAAAGGAVRVLHYRPGQAEGIADGYTVSAAANTGGKCRLTVATKIGSPVLVVAGAAADDDSHLTLPESANDDTYQALYMHSGDGAKFG